MSVEMSNLAEAKDWIYVFCTIIQTVLAIVALVLANWYWKRKERREEEERSEKERREEEERSEKEDREKKEHLDREIREKKERLDREIREKISKVFSERYYEIENEIEMMSKTLKRLKTTPIIRRRTTIYTSFDVLAYMCEASQRNIFQTPALKSFCKALDKIARFFQCFRVELPPTDEKCPKNIKEEMGPIIADIGNHIFPFVSKERQETIKWVLEYFEEKLIDENVTNPKTQIPRKQIPRAQIRQGTNPRGTNPPGHKSPGHKSPGHKFPGHKSPGHKSPRTQIPRTHNSQNTNLQNTIPYIKLLRFVQSSTGGSKISFDNAEICFIGRAQDQIINYIESSMAESCPNNSNDIINLLKAFMQNKNFLGEENEQVENQNEQHAYLLHLIHLLIYQLSEHKTLWNDEAYKQLERKLDDLLFPKTTDKNVQKTMCTRYLQDIQGLLRYSEGAEFEGLLEEKTTDIYNLLREINEKMEKLKTIK